MFTLHTHCVQLINLRHFLCRHKIPPRNLLNLAQRYHNNVTLQPLMAESSSIALLQPPPSWGLASNMDSDWVIRARILKEQGTKLNRHQRKNRKKLGNGTDYMNDNETASISTNMSEKGDKPPHKPPLLAVIASGTGPDGRAEARKLKKKRKVLTQSVVVIAFSIFALTAKTSFFSSSVPKQSSIHKEITVEEESRSLSEVSLDESDQHETTTIAPVEIQPDQSGTAILSTQEESEDAPTDCNIIRNESEGADSVTQLHVVESSSTAIAVVSPNRSQHLARAIGQIRAAVEEEVSFEGRGSARAAEAAQEIWRKQANSIKTQGGRILNFSKARLSQEAKKDVVDAAVQNYMFYLAV